MLRALRWFAPLLAIILMAYTGTTTFSSNNQVLTRGDVVALVTGGQLLWSSGSPGWSSTDGSSVSCSDFTTYVKNNGVTCSNYYGSLPTSASGRAISWGDAQALRVLTSVHSPILSNSSFQLGSYQGWTVSNSCGSAYSLGIASIDTDSDGYGSTMSTSGDATGGCEASITQVVNIPATPTSQSITFWYQGSAPAGSGDIANCNVQSASAAAHIQVNGITYTPTVANDGSWHQYTWNITNLVNGNNTISVYTNVASAESQNSHYDSRLQATVCYPATYPSASATVDDIILKATY